jgi:two-component system, OmpR family, copper resistance phosphate regulon response regulator CusR
MGGSGAFDLLVLDLGLPVLDGLSVLEELRRAGNKLPVVILTARSEVRETVEGLDLGADDYVTKPFQFEELLARIRARLRHEGDVEATELRAAGATLDLRTRRVKVGDRKLELSAREFALAEVLFRNVGQVLSREQLLSLVWGYDRDPGSNVVDVYVGYLRKKLGGASISTMRGMGYRLEA